jgi:hypothetical protein
VVSSPQISLMRDDGDGDIAATVRLAARLRIHVLTSRLTAQLSASGNWYDPMVLKMEFTILLSAVLVNLLRRRPR